MIDKILNDFLIQFLIEHRSEIIIGICICLKELLEYWLGKTNKVESGSVAELIILGIKKILK